MADYRGGERRGTGYGAALNKAIAEGRTNKQRERNFRQKLIFTGAQAGLTGLAGLIKGGISNQEQAIARDEAKAKYANTPAPDYKPMAAAPTDAKLPAWLTGGQGDRTELAMDNDVLAATRKPASANPYDEDPLVAAATAALQEPTPMATYPSKEKEPEKPARVTWGSGRGMMGSQ